jgi:hypothetical protein
MALTGQGHNIALTFALPRNCREGFVLYGRRWAESEPY